MGRSKQAVKKGLLLRQSLKKQRKQPASASAQKSLKVIGQLKEAGKEAHLKARKTRQAYAGHIRQGQEWLAGYFPTETNIDCDADHLAPEYYPPEEDAYTDPAFREAFLPIQYQTSVPTKHLLSSCHLRGSTKTLAKARLKLSELHSRICGRIEVNDVLSSLKHKANSEDGDQKHSLPMSQQYMDRMLLWSQEMPVPLNGT
ncbi:hypothetical protein PAXINDRAFT_19229 [Paxillus involutus ATCC 200175]|uniref:Uncharacterized protein n=1 Tax=Paxillus involutus ATCC 200175 TaxID=664439 RepID=A0A0C9SNA6_PAXIN|nr:hypothetical protein PAXINDRAFT_19229 [Paxillus involutus ATCC 200175]